MDEHEQDYGPIAELELTEGELAGLTTAQKMSLKRKAIFLRAFARAGVIADGIRAAGVSRKLVDYWKTDPWFLERFEAAEQEALDGLEREAHRRAVEGVDEPVTYQGMPTMIVDPETGLEKPFTVKRYSDSLLTLLLKAGRPDKYRERTHQQVEVGGSGVLMVPGAVTPEEWAKAAMAQQAAYAGNTGNPRKT